MKTKTLLLLLLGCTFLSTALVTILFLLSEEKMQRNNAFQRRYMPEAVEEIGQLTLDNTSYYIAGLDDGFIYLGDVAAPLYLTRVDTTLTMSEDYPLEISRLDLPYQRVKTIVNSGIFYLGDGTVPVVFKGDIDEPKGELFSLEDAFFNQFVIADSSTIGISTVSGTQGSIALGSIKILKDGNTYFEMNASLLEKQQDGVFDTDGMLLWNEKHHTFIYTYYYRNEYVMANIDLQHIKTATTIDTIRHAILDIAHHSAKDQYKLGGRSVYVNRQTATAGDYLYIHSDRLGRYEEASVLDNAGILDVYNITDQTYGFSFYIFHQTGKRLSDFRVFGDLLVVLVEDVLWLYRLNPAYFKAG